MALPLRAHALRSPAVCPLGFLGFLIALACALARLCLLQTHASVLLLSPPQSAEGYCFTNVRRWTRKFDLLAFDKVLVPIHLGVHWVLAVINLRDKRFEYYDSMLGDGLSLPAPRCL